MLDVFDAAEQCEIIIMDNEILPDVHKNILNVNKVFEDEFEDLMNIKGKKFDEIFFDIKGKKLDLGSLTQQASISFVHNGVTKVYDCNTRPEKYICIKNGKDEQVLCKIIILGFSTDDLNQYEDDDEKDIVRKSNTSKLLLG